MEYLPSVKYSASPLPRGGVEPCALWGKKEGGGMELEDQGVG